MAVTADPISPVTPTAFANSSSSNAAGDHQRYHQTKEEGAARNGNGGYAQQHGNANANGNARSSSSHRQRDGGGDMQRQRSGSGTIKRAPSHDSVQKLTAAEMQQLANEPRSLPMAPAPPPGWFADQEPPDFAVEREAIRQSLMRPPEPSRADGVQQPNGYVTESRGVSAWPPREARTAMRRAVSASRTASTPPTSRDAASPRRLSFAPAVRPQLDGAHGSAHGGANGGLASPPMVKAAPPSFAAPQPVQPPASGVRPPSPIPPMIPLPPMSIPTHLQLELAQQRPSPLYIHQSYTNDIPYESHAVKVERLKNVLLIPPFLERTLYFGALACLDAWLHTFTILPIRFTVALAVLARWWIYVIFKEARWLVGFVWYGLGRLWRRARGVRGRRISDASDSARSRSCSRASEASVDGVPPGLRHRPNAADSRVRGAGDAAAPKQPPLQVRRPGPKPGTFRHRRTKSMPSNLSSFHKADLLQGAVIICSSLVLMKLDASRMYHLIRAQSAIKLYVVYNILEVGDKLLSALGQDILECLFSSETLSRNASGRSKVLLPLGMFALALAYCVLHSVTLYYQVITLNAAVNSYSNALLTLLLSNQFVEIKSTVFKRFEKDSLFQLTCADIVERFHLWVMLLIIGMRNIVEVGGLSVPGAGMNDDPTKAAPLHSPSILPHSFTVLPSWVMSGEVLSPFLIVVGSEMLVDTIKHAYVTKFNNIKPRFYSRILDILCKDYYTNAFTAPALTRRLGLAVIPLSCLFIRASIQTYHMLLSAHVPMPLPISTQTSLTEASATPSSPAMIAALNRFDTLIRDSLGRATYGYPYDHALNSRPWYRWTSDDAIAAVTMVVVFFIIFLVLLILKLLLGMVLLKYARNRYAKMKHKEALVAAGKAERDDYKANGIRVGGFGEVEVSDDKRRWINADPTEGLQRKKKPADGAKAAAEGDYQGVFRYDMVEKRIW
ncbi:cytomegalovirus gh-receptor family [Trichoderma cornu-damae]|uniref:Cytomegalovirus gh-receptor family n=1 Tax=Trichoderma cornu-damae TaxID=654480 RepID=A0A9P8QRI1_9HYPO|nr:cytomegalovirus gh-receptor family [Trichoderma cornu-damae]